MRRILRDHLRFPYLLTCHFMLVSGWLVSPAVNAQELTDSSAAIIDARLAAVEGDYSGAFSQAISILEAHPESEWNAATLRRLITEVSQRWLHRMSPAQQEAALTQLKNPKSPGAKWTRAYLLWKRKQREQALSEVLQIIKTHPDGIGTEVAIIGYLVVQWPSLDHNEALRAVKTVVDAAPNNPGTGWALCRFTWRCGLANRPDLARQLYGQVQKSKPGTLASVVAGQLGDMLTEIDQKNYATALEGLKLLGPYLALATPPDSIIDTLCLGIDWTQPQTSAGSIGPLRVVFGLMAQNDPNPIHKSFGFAFLGRIAEKLGDKNEALKQFQNLVDVGDKTLGPYGMRRIARICHRSDPDRAIQMLESFRDEEEPTGITSMESTYMFLGQLYVRQKKYQTGETFYRWLRDRWDAGEFLRETVRDDEELSAGLAGCLFGQGKDVEAYAIIDPVLAKYGYGTPIAQLTRKARSDIAKLLFVMGKTDEASKYQRIP